jgi:hypothetical protein
VPESDIQILRLRIDHDNSARLARVHANNAIDDEMEDFLMLVRRFQYCEDLRNEVETFFVSGGWHSNHLLFWLEHQESDCSGTKQRGGK